MVRTCAAYGCNVKDLKGNTISFHKFPQDPELRRKWVIATKRKNFNPGSGTRICSKHFEKDAYQIRPGASFPLLNPEAVPSIFEFPPHLVKPPPKKRRILVRENQVKGDNRKCSDSSTPLCSDNDNLDVVGVAIDAPKTPKKLGKHNLSSKLMMKDAARREARKAQKALINKDPLAFDGEPMINVPSGSGCVVIKQEPIAEIYLDPLSIDQLEEPSAEGSMDPLAIGDLRSWAPSANGGEFSRSDAVPLELEEDDLIYFKSLAPDLAHLTPELKEVFRIKIFRQNDVPEFSSWIGFPTIDLTGVYL
ncbi:hypothetical protein GE061_005710 [Apolygus lucorum]|uniref:THAP-type domain-containing protein n=1 Tax=Apolygus lucorum TaxID=248454 RepID=A0A8S9WX64_APOLU|nr:hypothetical protein GE061_005710 [Apolygus lucorum]